MARKKAVPTDVPFKDKVRTTVSLPEPFLEKLSGEIRKENRAEGITPGDRRSDVPAISMSDVVGRLLWLWLNNGDVRDLERMVRKGGFPDKEVTRLGVKGENE